MYKYLKRIFDIIISLLVLIVFLVPMIIIGLIIKLESKGPAIFKQVRTGYKGREFYLYKFRSMSVDNDVLNKSSENKLTKVGKIIRKTSLDELPQVINILKGDMSLIGPRPWITEYYKNFTKEQKRRVDVKPGVTGLAQAVGRNNLSIFDKINYDLEYIDNYSLKMDIKVILLTIKTVVTNTGCDISKSGIHDELKELHNHYLQVTGKQPVITKDQLKEYEEKISI